jgi:acrylyl-CoA reductase (NADPH)
MDRFKALLISKPDASKGETGQQVNWTVLSPSDLMDGDVLVRVTHTTVNYKDGLAITGKGPVVRRWPMVPGIDGAGWVESSTHPDFKAGDDIILNGFGVGETHLGCYAQYARLKGDWLVHRPQAFSRAQTMAIGTAGYTAMLAVMALEHGGVTPDKGAVLVTGAAGGVGSVAVAILSKLGYQVIASTGRNEERAFLTSLGASEVIDRAALSGPAKPIGRERWAGAIDVAGSHTLANALASCKYGGTVAACGLAQGMDLASSVAPFILRGVTLAGIDSVMAPRARRIEAWNRLARDLDPAKLDALTVTRPLADAVALAPDILAGKVRGRVVFEVA